MVQDGGGKFSARSAAKVRQRPPVVLVPLGWGGGWWGRVGLGWGGVGVGWGMADLDFLH